MARCPAIEIGGTKQVESDGKSDSPLPTRHNHPQDSALAGASDLSVDCENPSQTARCHVSTKHFRPNEVTAEIEIWLEMITTQVMSRLWPPALFIATCLLFLVVRHRRSLNIHLEVPLPQTSPPISSDPVSTLAGLAAISPPVPINDTCLRPALPLVPACTDSAFSGEPMVRPRKLVLMLLFGFEVDTLEIHLREASDLVDVIFLVESTATHHGVRYNDDAWFL